MTKDNEKLKDEIKEDIDDLKELQEYIKNPDIGIDVDKLQAFVKQYRFEINPEGHVKKNRDKIREIQKRYEVEMKKALKHGDTMAQSDLYEEISKEILAIGLVDFNYDKWANHQDVGPTVLGHLCNELAVFLVVQGGKVGFKHWQMQQKSAMLNLSKSSNGMTD